jgi:hypothetical protein
MYIPELNQRLAVKNFPWNNVIIVWSHAHMVNIKANQKNNTTPIKNDAKRPIFLSFFVAAMLVCPKELQNATRN